MQAKIIKISVIIGGIVLAWFLLFFVFGKEEVGPQAKLEFWNVFDTTETMKPILKNFTAKTGIRVNYRSFTDLQDYRETLLLELASGGGPDVLAVHNSWLPKYRNLLQPLPKTMGFSAKDVARDFVDAVGKSVIFEEEIPKSDVKKGRVAEKQVFGLPMYLDTLALYFNKTFFRNILSKPYPAPELTWAGVREEVIKLSVQDAESPDGFRLAGIALGRADNITRGVDIFYALYQQFGGQNLSEAGLEKVRDDSGKFYKPLSAALSFITAFSRDSRNKEYSWNAEIAAENPEKEISAFASGKVAMIAGYSYYFESIRDMLEQQKRASGTMIELSEVGIAAFPQVRDPQAGNPKTAIADFFTLSVAKSSENPFESWQLILDLTSKNSQEKYFEATKKPTSRRDLIETQKADPLRGIFAEQAVFADILPIADDELFSEAVADVLDGVSNGDLSLEEGMRRLENKF